jgi:methyltransferase family protein
MYFGTLVDPTDRARWTDAASLDPEWDRRAEFVSRMIRPGTKVLDLGCGRMSLRQFLPNGCSYVGCDFIARDAETIVCNLNIGEFPDSAAAVANVITMLGLLEYILDVPKLLRRVAGYGKEVIFSYHPTGSFRRRIRARRRVGWVSDLSWRRVDDIIVNIGYRLVEVRYCTPEQPVYHIAPR